MKIPDLKLELRGPQTGLSLYDGNNYIATYCSANDFLMDLMYRHQVKELDAFKTAFDRMSSYNVIDVIEPYQYRGVCSEMFWPTDTIFRYVYYDNTISGIFEKFSFHEERAKRVSQHFEYGVQGSGIHRFNPKTHQYEFWVGGSDLKTVSDVMHKLKKERKIIPDKFFEEFTRDNSYDVFISHKHEDYDLAKKVYDLLFESGYKVFLSELSLPNIGNSDYTTAIDQALDKSQNMIVVATEIEKIESGWVKYEWTSFLNEKRSGRKNGNLITIAANADIISKLPFSLRQCEVIAIENIASIAKYL